MDTTDNLSNFVQASTETIGGKVNTRLTYSGKQLEYLEFCDAKYNGEEVVTEEKMFLFIFYTAFRSTRKSERRTTR